MATPEPVRSQSPVTRPGTPGYHFKACDWIGCPGCRTAPALAPGYAHKSTRRHPADPATVMLSDASCQGARFVGSAVIDGTECNAFRVGRVYYFQTAHGS